MDSNAGQFVPREGMQVIGSDGERVGKVALVEQAYLIVQQGLFPQDHYIPLSAIASHDDDTIHLAITKDEALERGLGNPMVAYDEPASGGTDAPDDHLPVQDITAGATPIEQGADPGLAMTGTEDAIIAADEAAGSDDRHRTIELHQEEVTATTRPVERGVVRVQKQVVEEKQTFEVPVVEEEVIVTRRRVDLDPGDPSRLFTEEHLEIPLRGQEVEIETQSHVVEEVEVNTSAHQRIERITETVRHEELRIEGDGVELDAAAEDDRVD